MIDESASRFLVSKLVTRYWRRALNHEVCLLNLSETSEIIQLADISNQN